VVTAQDIVNSAYKLKGSCYRTWYYGASIPMWTDDNAGDPPPLAHLQYYGVMCSDLVNWALVDNGLSPGGGTAAFADYLVDTSYFDPTTPGVPGAIALSPYQSPEVGYQGHIAIYVDEHYLIQALHTPGITDQFTDAESYSWGGDTAFTTYGFLPGVDYSGSVSTTASASVSTPPAKPELPNWFGVGKDGVVRLGGDWSKGWVGQDTNGYLKYKAEYQEEG